MPKTASGEDVVRVLCKHFGFVFVSQKGSHVKLRKSVEKITFTTIVPMHDELAIGTLRGILDLAHVSWEEFKHHL